MSVSGPSRKERKELIQDGYMETPEVCLLWDETRGHYWEPNTQDPSPGDVERLLITYYDALGAAQHVMRVYRNDIDMRTHSLLINGTFTANFTFKPSRLVTVHDFVMQRQLDGFVPSSFEFDFSRPESAFEEVSAEYRAKVQEQLSGYEARVKRKISEKLRGIELGIELLEAVHDAVNRQDRATLLEILGDYDSFRATVDVPALYHSSKRFSVWIDTVAMMGWPLKEVHDELVKSRITAMATYWAYPHWAKKVDPTAPVTGPLSVEAIVRDLVPIPKRD